ncbi:MAG: hypothetical protein AB7I68_12360 [Porticoccaceae bacterium]
MKQPDPLITLIKRSSWPGWILFGLAAVAFLADLEATLQLIKRLTGAQLPRLGPRIPWLFLALGFLYLLRLWHAESRNEPLRQLLRLSALPAISHCLQLRRAAGELLAQQGPTGRIAQIGLEDGAQDIDRSRTQITKLLETPSLISRLRTTANQRAFVALLNTYERAVYRLRDAGIAADFDWTNHPNFAHWKRHDSDLIEGVRRLLHQSRYSRLGDTLENSGMWKEGLRTYL